MTERAGALYLGRVTHRRLKPVGHRLCYRVFSALLDLDRLDELDRNLRLFSRNRFNLFSFHDRDHGDGKPANLAAYIRATLHAAGLAADGRILLLCYPRILGFAFNPLAVYYCHDAAGSLSANIYEVRNTFGGRHSYLIPAPGDGEIVRQKADKVFHVSPFMEMATRYHFRLTRPGSDISVAIRQTDAEGGVLHATFAGARAEMTDKALFGAFLAYPLMTLKVVAAIHWEALKLLLKGLKLVKGAPDPKAPVSVIRVAE